MYEDKDLFIFDLDDTLLLHKVDKFNRKIYEDQLISFLHNLKNSGKILTLVTYNTYPEKFLNKNSIHHLFDYIYRPEIVPFNEYQNSNKFYENASIWVIGNTVKICTCKSIIIKEIIENYKCHLKKIIFFDDHKFNVDKVKKLGIDSILVDPFNGIPLPKI